VSVEHALSLLEPYPAAQMRSVAVSPLVNSVRNDGPELLAPA
jgi:putative SOS response-associated peptidase YedK